VVRRVLIANRGEIGVRVIQACRELGIESVAACTAGEIGSTAGELADDVAVVPSYLDAEALTAAAVAAGADAVHPGYGFLSEDARFAEAVVAAGLAWVGPPPDAMRALGDKERAREIAEHAGVPILPGATGSDDALRRAADRLGPPLLVKASGGGGGRGMRSVDDLAELDAALTSAREEARAAFGDDRVFLERRLSGGRHVEVQILADADGRVIHLGERDCSLQRRHQKVLEEAPSPGVGGELRRRIGAAAVAVASAARYRGAGTVEFLLLPDGSFAFLEMNARLQVEHPVTEAVTGVDLVHAQLAIAAGSPLPVARDENAPLNGHAIEVRVYAEDPANGFVPTGGRVRRLVLPRWPGVRIDTALREGDDLTLDFDPLVAKVIAWADDRAACLRKLRAALASTAIVGVPTNLGFLLDILQHPDVVDGRVDTDWIERTWRGSAPALPAGVDGSAADARDPWRRFGEPPSQTEGVVVADGWAQYEGWAYRLAGDDLESVTLTPPGGSLTAPMPAAVRHVHVSEGDRVREGDAMVVLEAMKMQLAVTTPASGTVSAVRVREGDVVAAGAVLVEIEEDGA
jgi:acetyl/propionyl-CoA carboxylase alpha subunit